MRWNLGDLIANSENKFLMKMVEAVYLGDFSKRRIYSSTIFACSW